MINWETDDFILHTIYTTDSSPTFPCLLSHAQILFQMHHAIIHIHAFLQQYSVR